VQDAPQAQKFYSPVLCTGKSKKTLLNIGLLRKMAKSDMQDRVGAVKK
jgi:hypothetical protein